MSSPLSVPWRPGAGLRWRWLLCWVLALLVPLQAASAAMLQAKGTSHVHRPPAVRAAAPSAQPAGFEWAASPRLRATPTTASVIAAIRANAHGVRVAERAHPVPAADSAQRTGSRAPLEHDHGASERHFHGPGDASVLQDEPADAPRDGAGTQAAGAAWAPPAQAGMRLAAPPAAGRIAAEARPWRSHVAAHPERPPR